MNRTATIEHQPIARDGISQQLDYENQYVSFWLENQLLGIPVNAVQEVLNPQKIARTPLARSEVAGLLNLRGQVVTAVNLRKRMNLPPTEVPVEEHMNVVVRYAGESFSLLVDEVGDVINVSGQTMERVPSTLDAHWKAITSGVFRLEGRLFIIINVEALFSQPSN
ncbi:MAG: chemotaxis protein CheW [Planctomycetaceae bacterium]